MGLFRKKAKSFYWVTPLETILSDPPAVSAGAGADPNPEYIQQLFLACGVSVVPAGVSVSSSVLMYNFKLPNISQYAKAKKAVEAVSAGIRRKAVFSTDAAEGAHFALAVVRAERATLHFKRAILTYPFAQSKGATACIFGQDVNNKTVTVDLEALPHLLIAGSTGSGKSVLLHTVICSMLLRTLPSRTKFLMIDPKRIELKDYAGLPHLMRPVITDVQEAIKALAEMCALMDRRYMEIQTGRAVDHPRIVIVIDELADLMMVSRKAVEASIVRLAQLGRACGIHLIAATQRPTVNVCTGLIKANMPARIALTMASYRDAGVIEIPGADKLGGKGDALYQGPDHTVPPVRFQTAYISQQDIKRIVSYWQSPDARRPASAGRPS